MLELAVDAKQPRCDISCTGWLGSVYLWLAGVRVGRRRIENESWQVDSSQSTHDLG